MDASLGVCTLRLSRKTATNSNINRKIVQGGVLCGVLYGSTVGISVGTAVVQSTFLS